MFLQLISVAHVNFGFLVCMSEQKKAHQQKESNTEWNTHDGQTNYLQLQVLESYSKIVEFFMYLNL